MGDGPLHFHRPESAPLPPEDVLAERDRISGRCRSWRCSSANWRASSSFRAMSLCASIISLI